MVLRTKGLEHFFLARPGLIFEGKFRSLPSGNHLANIKTSLERLAFDKCSSLFGLIVSDEE